MSAPHTPPVWSTHCTAVDSLTFLLNFLGISSSCITEGAAEVFFLAPPAPCRGSRAARGAGAARELPPLPFTRAVQLLMSVPLKKD